MTTTTTTAEDLRGRTALVTGATTGIGAEFAARLAQRGADLVLVARSQPVLDTLAGDLRDRHGVDVLPLALDLAVSGAAGELARAVAAADITVDTLINSAGVAVTGPVAAADPAAVASMIGLNATALTEEGPGARDRVPAATASANTSARARYTRLMSTLDHSLRQAADRSPGHTAGSRADARRRECKS